MDMVVVSKGPWPHSTRLTSFVTYDDLQFVDGSVHIKDPGGNQIRVTPEVGNQYFKNLDRISMHKLETIADYDRWIHEFQLREPNLADYVGFEPEYRGAVVFMEVMRANAKVLENKKRRLLEETFDTAVTSML